MAMTKKLDETQSIPGFFAGRSIFVTGATGFMGKVLIEKILRSCPGVREIFLLLRPKNGVSIDDRLRKMLTAPIFDKLREKNPSCFAKLIPVIGDVTEEGLGLRPVERQVMIERVSIIYHVAANVRFNEDLKKDIFSNTRSTRDVCILGCEMKNLVALVHVSSTYAHCDKPVVEEVVYPHLTDWRKTIKTVECLDDHTMRIFSAKYLGTMPNTYTFSKRLAENVITDYSKHIPCVIFRPSIVVSSIEEPVPGWVDNFNGPVGLMVGGGKGILQVTCANKHICQDYVPVDIAIKTMLTITWMRGTETITKNPEVQVFNCASNNVRRISIYELIKLALSINDEIPLAGIMWRPRTLIVRSTNIFFILTILLHLMPAILIDTILRLYGRRPMLLKLQRKIYAATMQISFFLQHEWDFKNEKLREVLMDKVPLSDKAEFTYDYQTMNMTQYFRECLIGAKLYLLKEDVNDLTKARQHFNRIWWIDRIFHILLTIFAVWMLAKVEVFSWIWAKLESISNGSIFDV